MMEDTTLNPTSQSTTPTNTTIRSTSTHSTTTPATSHRRHSRHHSHHYIPLVQPTAPTDSLHTTSKESKRRSMIYPTGTPIIPMDPTFGSSSTSNSLSLSEPSTPTQFAHRITTDPIMKHSSHRNLNHYQTHPDQLSTNNTSTNAIQSKPQAMIKLLLIGDANVGKSALILSYCDNFFSLDSTRTTIGVDLKIKIVNVDGIDFKAVIWDTAGQERYRNVIPSLYKGTNGIMLTYDLTDRLSFKGLYHWVEECFENTVSSSDQSETIFYIVGNKLDQIDSGEKERQVSKEDIKKFIHFVKTKYPSLKIHAVFEVSARYGGGNVYGLFDTVIKDLVENRCYLDEEDDSDDSSDHGAKRNKGRRRAVKMKKSVDLSTGVREQGSRGRNCCSY
ncbi:hypothetical protein WICPIJ_008700 [Wickerhamomyces pijperi]|uniref:Uncharacterized protein n=1 Tax=Wickerhamomyces pijperi TaxID=599730 RepID=A0A9P8PX71_WICPI|nr:hypothetical protein WICPIJ_008700 [Wickerhamomyces pijperi]